MFMLGFALLGSTLLLPLFLQTLMGYTAQLSGMALSPGGFAIMVLMPLVGFLLSRYDARYLMLFGLSMLSFSLFHMTNFDLNIDFKTAVLGARLPGGGTGVPVCAHQHGGLLLPPEREEQCGFGPDESGAQYRRQRRHLFCDHHARSPYTEASERSDRSFDRGQCAIPGHAAGQRRNPDRARHQRAPTPKSRRTASCRTFCSGRPPCWPTSTISISSRTLSGMVPFGVPDEEDEIERRDGGTLNWRMVMFRIIALEREYGCGCAGIAAVLRSACTGSSGISRLPKRSPNRRMSTAEPWNSARRKIDGTFYRLAKAFWRGSYERSMPIGMSRRHSMPTVW